MAFFKDIQDKIILGRWRFLNLFPLISDNTRSVGVDENGNLGIIEDSDEPVSVSWDDVEDKPTSFPPSAHNQAFTTITGVATAAQIPALAISKTTGLQAALDSKADTSALTSGLAGKVNTSDVGDLSTKDTIVVPTDITATGTPSATTYLRGDGSWNTPTNTTYTNMTQAEADAGTVTTGRTISALVLETKINNKIAPKLTASQGTAVADAVDDTDIVAQFNSLLASLRTAGIIAT